MREAINFTFDGVSSEDMGVIIASPNGGLFNETFLPTRNIIETSVANNYKPYHQRVELSPLSFSLSIFIHEWRDRQNLRQIAKWLMKDYYVPLTFETNPDRVFYAMVDGDSSLIHNGCKDGYVELNIRCNSPFTYSHAQAIESTEVRVADVSSHIISIFNSGDRTIKPKLWITKRNGNGSVSIENEDTEQIMTIDNLLDGEQVYIDVENDTIVSDLEILNVYRYDDHNNVWLELIEGENTLVCTGDFDIEIEYEMIYLAD